MRTATVSGHFYPSDKNEILNYFKIFEQTPSQKNFQSIYALIVPHAGYIYSGQTAYFAYKEASRFNYKRVIVIGPSHRIGYEGASVSLFNSYQTPLGNIDIDLKYAQILTDKFNFFGFHPDCHKEHSTETQAPFIKHYLPTCKIIEIVYSKLEPKSLALAIKLILKDPSNLLVISTDLSHFYDLKTANTLDRLCIDAIKSQNPSNLHTGCEACGIIGVEALLLASNQKDSKVEILNYTTSAEKSGDKDRVVGYVSALLGT